MPDPANPQNALRREPDLPSVLPGAREPGQLGLHPRDGAHRDEREPGPGLGGPAPAAPRVRRGHPQHAAARERVPRQPRDRRRLRAPGGAQQRDAEGPVDQRAAPGHGRLRAAAGAAHPLRQRRHEPLHRAPGEPGVGAARSEPPRVRRVLERDLGQRGLVRAGRTGRRTRRTRPASARRASTPAASASSGGSSSRSSRAARASCGWPPCSRRSRGTPASS